MIFSKLIKVSWLPMAAIYMMLAPSAGACPATGNAAKINASRLRALLTGMSVSVGRTLNIEAPKRGTADQSRLDIVGMWELTQTIDGQMFDHALQQFYTDGNEMQNSAVVPPSLGNICFGVWERTGNRTFRMKHYGWNFDASGNFSGTFFLTATVTMTDADNYTGVFVTDTLLLSGEPDPNLHGEGTIEAKRIKFEP